MHLLKVMRRRSSPSFHPTNLQHTGLWWDFDHASLKHEPVWLEAASRLLQIAASGGSKARDPGTWLSMANSLFSGKQKQLFGNFPENYVSAKSWCQAGQIVPSEGSTNWMMWIKYLAVLLEEENYNLLQHRFYFCYSYHQLYWLYNTIWKTEFCNIAKICPVETNMSGQMTGCRQANHLHRLSPHLLYCSIMPKQNLNNSLWHFVCCTIISPSLVIL